MQEESDQEPLPSTVLPPALPESARLFWQQALDAGMECYGPAFASAQEKYGKDIAIFGMLLAAYAHGRAIAPGDAARPANTFSYEAKKVAYAYDALVIPNS
jgi:hypothetical protein